MCYKIGTLECSTLQVATKLEPYRSLNLGTKKIYKIRTRSFELKLEPAKTRQTAQLKLRGEPVLKKSFYTAPRCPNSIREAGQGIFFILEPASEVFNGRPKQFHCGVSSNLRANKLQASFECQSVTMHCSHTCEPFI